MVAGKVFLIGSSIYFSCKPCFASIKWFFEAQTSKEGRFKKIVKDIEVEKLTDIDYSDEEINDEVFDFEEEIID